MPHTRDPSGTRREVAPTTFTNKNPLGFGDRSNEELMEASRTGLEPSAPPRGLNSPTQALPTPVASTWTQQLKYGGGNNDDADLRPNPLGPKPLPLPMPPVTMPSAGSLSPPSSPPWTVIEKPVRRRGHLWETVQHVTHSVQCSFHSSRFRLWDWSWKCKGCEHHACNPCKTQEGGAICPGLRRERTD